MDAETRELMKAQAITVWLRAELDVIWKRVSRRDTRPLLRQADPRGVLERLHALREPVYATADIMVESNEGPAADVAADILDRLATR
jgi:shikimate kinase